MKRRKRRSGEARQQAAKVTGTNAHYVSDAKKLKETAPELFEKVKAGTTTLVAAKREIKEQAREERREENRQKVADIAPAIAIAKGAKFATIVIDPPWTGASGQLVSPSSNRTRARGSSSASAATCVIAV